jgi:hypothetical protein
MTACIGGRAHAVHEKRVRTAALGWVEAMLVCQEPIIGHATPIKFREERPKPLRMFKKDGEVPIVVAC